MSPSYLTKALFISNVFYVDLDTDLATCAVCVSAGQIPSLNIVSLGFLRHMQIRFDTTPVLPVVVMQLTKTPPE